MKNYIVKILKVGIVTHDVRSFKVEKPNNYNFIPGQAVDLSINLPDYKDKKRPFTLTSLNEDPFLQFTIKTYPERNNVTKNLLDLKPGNEFVISEPWGDIHYEKKGVFIAGGAGITPFIAILRQLRKESRLKGNMLIFSNKMEKDIILKPELDEMSNLGLKLIYTLTRENKKNYENRHIDKEFLKEKISDFKQHFYVCGPIKFVGEIQHTLKELGAKAESIILEG